MGEMRVNLNFTGAKPVPSATGLTKSGNIDLPIYSLRGSGISTPMAMVKAIIKMTSRCLLPAAAIKKVDAIHAITPAQSSVVIRRKKLKEFASMTGLALMFLNHIVPVVCSSCAPT